MELACPHCLAVNRVPDDRLADAPKCGKCGSPLLPGTPLDLTADSFDRFIARAGLPVLGIHQWPTAGKPAPPSCRRTPQASALRRAHRRRPRVHPRGTHD